VTLRASASVALAAVAVVGLTACSSSTQSATTTTTTAGSTKSPIVVKTPVPESQWRSPMTVKGTTTLTGELTAEVLDAAGKQLGSEATTPSDGHFAVKVPFSVKKLAPAALLVHDEHSDHSVQVAVVVTP
jgi:type IV pilus biogenesis protein CpaD/CtpE